MAEIYKSNGSSYDKIVLDPSSIDTNRSETFVQTKTRSMSFESVPADMPNMGSWIGTQSSPQGDWYNVISVRHRNGTGDGPGYGWILYTNLTDVNDSVHYVHQSVGNWSDTRTFVDSANPEVVVSSSQPTNSNAKIWVKI